MRERFCYICHKQFKEDEWKYSFNKGLCCYKCSPKGKLRQELDLFQEKMRELSFYIKNR